MARRMEAYALLLPFSLQDVPAGAPAADLSSSSRAEAAAPAAPGRSTQRLRRTMIGVTALLSVTFIVIALLVATDASPPRGTADPAASVSLASEKAKKDSEKPKGVSTCHTAVKGEACHTDVIWAMKDQSRHPEWYQGLNNESTFTDFQEFMHGQVLNSGARRCPKPCGTPSAKKGHKARKKKPASTKKTCHTAVPGEECYNHVIYTKKEAIKYPRWYPGIDEKSTLVDVQHYLQQENVCPEPCELAEGDEAARANFSKNATKDCHTSHPGETCYSDILYAMDNIGQHPAWYPGLTNYSTKEHFQAFLHGQSSVDEEAEKKKCPMPCDRQAAEEVRIRAKCETASEPGEKCFESVRWGATVGVRRHPSWYPNLTKYSSVEEFQLHLHEGPNTTCPKRPCPCHTSVEGEPCYKSVMWVKEVGLRKHPGHFWGLSNTSSFQEIQAHLHTERTTPCPKPCTILLPW